VPQNLDRLRLKSVRRAREARRQALAVDDPPEKADLFEVEQGGYR